MKVRSMLTRSRGERLDIHWSSLAEQPAVWLRIEGGESIDPRDRRALARLPITNATLLTAPMLRSLAAEATAWAEELGRADAAHAYLGTDEEWPADWTDTGDAR